MGAWDWANSIGSWLNPFSPDDKNQRASMPQAQASAPSGDRLTASFPFGDMFNHSPGEGSDSFTGAPPEAANPDMENYLAMLRGMASGGPGYDAGAPYDSQINELRRQLAMAQGLNNQGKSDVNIGFNNLANYWKKDVPLAFRQIYGGSLRNTNSSADKLKAAIKTNFDKATAGTAQQMAKYGINTGTMGQATAQHVADKASQAQGELTGLADARQGANADYYRKLNASAGAFATNNAGLTKSAQQNALGALRQQLYNTTMETEGRIGDLMHERGAAINKAAAGNRSQQLAALKALVEAQSGPSVMDQIAAARAKIGLETDQAGQGGGAAIDYLRNAVTKGGITNQTKLDDLVNAYNYVTGSDFTSKYKDNKPSSGDITNYLKSQWQGGNANNDAIKAILDAISVARGQYGASDYGQ